MRLPECYFLVFWPEEDCYSEVPESKVVGEHINIKEGAKVHKGVLAAVGSQQEVQQKLEEMASGEPDDRQGNFSALKKICVLCTTLTFLFVIHSDATASDSC